MQPHPLREVIADHACKNCRYPERGCVRYMRLDTCQEFQPNDDAIFREIVRLKIAHLRRMREAALGLARRRAWCLDAMESRDAARIDRNAERYRRFAKACLGKIAELKVSQCSTKS